VGEVWPTTYITELCLQLIASSEPRKQMSTDPKVAELSESDADCGLLYLCLFYLIHLDVDFF